jgi:hypothetical protein
MSTDPQIERALSVTRPSRESSAPAELPLFCFGLRQLFMFVAGLSILLAGMVIVDGRTATVLLIGTLVVAAHVAATALGARLRLYADRRREKSDQGDVDDLLAAVSRRSRMTSVATGALHPAARSPWYTSGSTPLSWMPRFVVAGVLVGGVIGIVVLITVAGPRASHAGLLVGCLSMAVLGGWFAFLSGSFVAILRHGLRDAIAQHRKDEQVAVRPPR